MNHTANRSGLIKKNSMIGLEIEDEESKPHPDSIKLRELKRKNNGLKTKSFHFLGHRSFQ